jgi:hypothetical protein
MKLTKIKVADIKEGDVIMPPGRELRLWMRRHARDNGMSDHALTLTVMEIEHGAGDKRGPWVRFRCMHDPEWKNGHPFSFVARPWSDWKKVERGVLTHDGERDAMSPLHEAERESARIDEAGVKALVAKHAPPTDGRRGGLRNANFIPPTANAPTLGQRHDESPEYFAAVQRWVDNGTDALSEADARLIRNVELLAGNPDPDVLRDMDRRLAPVKKMVVATLETSNFDFVTLAADEKSARDQLKLAWSRHRRETGATGNWSEFEDGVHIHEMKPGDVMRDGFII